MRAEGAGGGAAGAARLAAGRGWRGGARLGSPARRPEGRFAQGAARFARGREGYTARRRPPRLAWLIIARPPAPAVFGWGKKGGGGQASTKCEKCGAELYYAERLERHMKKAHGNVPAKKPDAQGGDGGLW